MIEQLLDIMARLRDPHSGCPWDLEQTFQTLVPHTIEEAYEVAEAIRHGDMVELKDELGDLLFQIAFYAQLARERGDFNFGDIVQAISDKMRRRHPHVFGQAVVNSAAEQTLAWERHKAEERTGRGDGLPVSCLDGIALALPALIRAEKLQKRAAREGFDWDSLAGVVAKVEEELAEVVDASHPDQDLQGLRDEVGDLLFSCVNLARHLGVNPETSLRQANQKFETRFREMEARLAARGDRISALEMSDLNALWETVKAESG
ncbi:MAG: nucleoside triphosphate pyrophosphohydrolase [Gammaproteobacteria bacterium]|nr:nucleoside triphosphate pyrophosphohydrolase [Gammaproteobacteria bacterium]